MALRPVLLIIALCSAHMARCQWSTATEMDSLRGLLENSSTDTARLRILDAIITRHTVSAQARQYLDRVDSITRELADHPDDGIRRYAMVRRAGLHFHRGYQAKYQRRMREALGQFGQAVELHGRLDDPRQLVFDHDGMGLVYRAIGMPRAAIVHFREEYRQAERTGEAALRTQARIHIAAAYNDLGDTARARAVLDSCETPDWSTTSLVLLERSRLALIKGDTAAAIALSEKAVSAVDTAHAWNMIITLEPLARTYWITGRAEEALRTARHCIGIAERLGDEAVECGCRVIAGMAAERSGDEVQAEDQLLRALKLSKQWGYVGLCRESGEDGSMFKAAGVLKDLYARQGRLREALGMTTYWATLGDSITAREGLDAVLRHDLERTRLLDSTATAGRIAQATRELRDHLAGERQRRRWIIVGGSVLFLLSATATLWYIDRRRRRLRYEQEQAVLHERLRIADDLHDDLGAGLSALKLRSALALEQADGNGMNDRLRQIMESADALVGNMRQILWAMGTEHTTLPDLARFIGVQARQVLDGRNITLALEVPTDLPAVEIDATTRRNVFLIVKEALHNVVKHACARMVTLSFRHEDGLEVRITDDGSGMRTDGPSGGNGLRIMRKRAAVLGGSVTMEAGPDGGTTVWLRAPLIGPMNKGSITAERRSAQLRLDDER